MRVREGLRVLLVTAVLGTGAGPAAAQSPQASTTQNIDWDSVGQETADILSRYIRVNTTNPPGHEIEAARFLRDLLIQDGIEFLLLDQGNGKAALVGRLPAAREPKKGSIILLNHMDVVPVSREYWSVDPFAGLIKDGYVWGRGALDMKGEAVAELMAMVLLKRHGPPLDRDIVFLATSDEEIMGGTDAGAFVREHRDLISNAEFLLNEGGAIRLDESGALQYYGVGVTEKSPFWQRVTAYGTSGHGSMPIDSSAVNRLVRALERARTWRTEVKLTPPVAEFFHRLATIAPPEKAALYANIEEALTDSAGRAAILSDRYQNAILRNTISITEMEGSSKTNVIPPTARAEMDVRLLPGEDPDAFLTKLRERMGAAGDSLKVEPIGATWPATASPTDGQMFRAIEATAQELDAGAAVLPYVLAGFTDSHYFRSIGIQSYGIGLFKLPPSESERVHGNDERVSIDNLKFGTRLLYDVLRRVGR